ncbi:MAG: tyrosine--tRNA ligase [Candidatus Latescibacterota bacterium]
MDILEDLDFRGLVYQLTDRDGLAERLARGPITLYNGFDPSNDSMTVGNLVTILLLRRFQLCGHCPIALVGGGTGLIGDPSGKSEERALNPEEVVAAWSERFRRQLEPYLDFEVRTNPARIVNNHDWLGKIRMIDFLREVGKHFSVPYMLAKESVSSRLDSGISYTEFSYMMLQSYDFLMLQQTHGCELQTGGSDQWGNITAGADLVRRAAGARVFGLTCPLVTKADGTKFGKTETGAVWLDPERTTPYEFYQFWINAEDDKVVEYLKFYTFLGRADIRELEEATRQHPERREAQRRLAEEVTALVHGAESAHKAERVSRALFYGEFGDLSEEEILLGFHDVPTHHMAAEEAGLVDLLVEAGACPSRRQARQDIASGAIYVNGERCTALDRRIRRQEGLHGCYHILRRGRRSYYLVD